MEGGGGRHNWRHLQGSDRTVPLDFSQRQSRPFDSSHWLGTALCLSAHLTTPCGKPGLHSHDVYSLA